MKKIKKIEAGATFTVKVPTNASQQTLDFLNRERSVSRNKFVYWVLEKEAHQVNNNELSIPISFSLTKAEKERLLDPSTLKSLEAFVKALIGIEPTNESMVEDFNIDHFSGLINYE